ncbi:Dephospho-CoA kinase domain-containing protein [Pseudolycoriella hygida]|uniref:Dephospho-CoA kinase domain-containing protein n=1 Tax=Pseudolycoriella hygida TaxID=35572 RepID=A0A9Q0MKL3_9DIPT|nr:Dephospho-CoA kinase domain-containing protein [Pseudolycoriella hygida]
MFIVALTGGIATGKTSVTKVFKENGIPVVDADQIAREVVEPGKPAWKKIKAEFGEDVFNDDDTINREKLGKLIFDNIDKRRFLNSATHPEIHRRIYIDVIKCFIAGHNFVVVDLPLLFETGVMIQYCYKIITVTCEEDIQLTRLMDRNKLSEADAKKRISAQMPLELKCSQSHFVIENSGTLNDTEQQALQILEVLLESNHHWKIRGIILTTAAVFFSGVAWLLDYKYKIWSQ